MDERERREHLLAVVSHTLQAHREWVDSDTPYITEEFAAAVDELVEVFASGSIPGDCRELARRVAALAAEWQRWTSRRDETGKLALMPDGDFWHALEGVGQRLLEAQRPRRKALESVKTLLGQGVSPRQICLIYGWLGPGGEPEIWKVEEEQDSPGKHSTLDPAWCDPRERRHREVERRQEESLRKYQERSRAKLQRVATPPESLAELIGQGVTLRQISRILGAGEAEILQECARQGLPQPAAADDLHAQRGRYDQPIEPETARAMDARVEEGLGVGGWDLGAATSESIDPQPPTAEPRPDTEGFAFELAAPEEAGDDLSLPEEAGARVKLPKRGRKKIAQ